MRSWFPIPPTPVHRARRSPRSRTTSVGCERPETSSSRYSGDIPLPGSAAGFSGEPRNRVIVFLAGLLTLLFAPRLIRSSAGGSPEASRGAEKGARGARRASPGTATLARARGDAVHLDAAPEPAYMDETGADLAEAKAAVEKLLGKA
jgi:hypothetical protein